MTTPSSASERHFHQIASYKFWIIILHYRLLSDSGACCLLPLIPLTSSCLCTVKFWILLCDWWGIFTAWWLILTLNISQPNFVFSNSIPKKIITFPLDAYLYFLLINVMIFESSWGGWLMCPKFLVVFLSPSTSVLKITVHNNTIMYLQLDTVWCFPGESDSMLVMKFFWAISRVMWFRFCRYQQV